MIFVKKIKEDGYITKEELRQFLIVLNPLAPHISSEMYERVFGKDILDETFPEVDETKLEKDEITLPMQINGKVKGTVCVPKNATKEQVEQLCYETGKVNASEVKKVIYVPGRIVNFIC